MAEDWTTVTHYRVVRLATLPAPGGLEQPACMTSPIPAWQRWYRRRRPRPNVLGCCWYHQGDWGEVNRHAIGFLRSAEQEGLVDQELVNRVGALAHEAELSPWTHTALIGLFGARIFLTDDPPRMLADGRHRVTAMLQAGVRHTIVATDELIDAATGRRHR